MIPSPRGKLLMLQPPQRLPHARQVERFAFEFRRNFGSESPTKSSASSTNTPFSLRPGAENPPPRSEGRRDWTQRVDPDRRRTDCWLPKFLTTRKHSVSIH